MQNIFWLNTPLLYKKKKKIFFSRSFSKNKNINTEVHSSDQNSFLSTIVIKSGEKDVKIERTKDWFINITKVSIFFNRRWRNWKKQNQKVIDTFQLLEGNTVLIRELGRKNQKQTYLNIKLALRVLNDFDPVLSWEIFSVFLKSLSKDKEMILQELKKAYETIELSKAEIAHLKNKSFTVDLNGGKCLFYAYLCNNIVKWGTSFTNIDGQRPKAHKTSIPNLEFGFIIYSSKENLQNLNRSIKIHFKIKSKKEHLNCSLKELESFVINYMDVMKFTYKREDTHKLKLLSILCKSN